VEKAKEDGEKLTYEPGQFPLELACMVLGCFMVFGALFATGFWLYGEITSATIATVVALVSGFAIFKLWGKLKMD